MIGRASFLQQAASLVVAITLPSCAAPGVIAKSQGASEANPLGGEVYPRVDSWLALDSRGIVTVFFGKVELGTGVATAISQLVADELYVPFSSVRVIAADTSSTPNQGYTAGSQTLTSGATPVRQAAATARAKLLALAAVRLNASSARLATRAGSVYDTAAPHKSVSYADLIGSRHFDENIPAKPIMRKQSSFTVSGTSIPRLDIPPKIFGDAAYLQDMRLPNMLHGRVIYPPGPGATLESFDEKPLSHIGEPVRVVRIGNFLGVVAQQEWHAVRAARELTVSWKPASALPEMSKLAEAVLAIAGTDRLLGANGDVDGQMESGRTLAATYSWPFQSHGSIGPSCSLADVRSDVATVWSTTQGVFQLRGAIAQMLGRKSDSVRVIYAEGAGCYGQNGADDAAAAAALMSREVGRPIRLQYMRSDETRWDPKGPAMVMDMRGALGDDGSIKAWGSHVFTPSHSGRPDGFAGNLFPALLSGTKPADVTFVGGDRDALINYNIPTQNAVITDQKTAVIRQSALRGLGGTQNTFANESFMEELAHLAGQDSFEFRMRHLKSPRERAVLEALRHAYRPDRGLAWVHYENTQAIVAAVADVSVNTKSGAVRVNHVWIAHDCGLIVNPDGLRNQIEGNVIQATSRALLEEVRFTQSAITSVDWETYPILRFGDIPEVSITLLNYPDQPILGAGEATTTVIAPAIANAIFAKTGARIRSAPFTPSKILAALASTRKQS